MCLRGLPDDSRGENPVDPSNHRFHHRRKKLKIFSLALKEETKFPSGRAGILNLRAIDPFYYELLKGLRAKVEYKMDTLNLRVLAVSSAVCRRRKNVNGHPSGRQHGVDRQEEGSPGGSGSAETQHRQRSCEWPRIRA